MKAPLPWLALALLAGGPCAAAPVKLGPDALPYPASSTSEPVMQAWINRYLPYKGFVVGAWSPNVVMLVSTAKLQSDRYPEVTTEVWSEVLNRQAAAEAGWRAAVAVLVFACDRNQYRTLSMLYFARGDRRGEVDQELGDDAWFTPESDSTMDTVERAACFYGSGHALAVPPAGPQAKGKANPQPESAPSLHGLKTP